MMASVIAGCPQGESRLYKVLKIVQKSNDKNTQIINYWWKWQSNFTQNNYEQNHQNASRKKKTTLKDQ